MFPKTTHYHSEPPPPPGEEWPGPCPVPDCLRMAATSTLVCTSVVCPMHGERNKSIRYCRCGGTFIQGYKGPGIPSGDVCDHCGVADDSDLLPDA